MAKKVDLKAKAKRQKIIAAVGGVLLLGVMAIQVPRTLNMMKGSPPPPPAAAAPVPGAVDPSVLPTPGSVSGSDGDTQASGAGDGTLIDSEPPPAATTGQLVSFGRFKSKDPFAQQVVPVDNSANNDDQPASPAGTKAGGTKPPSSGSSGPTAAAGTAVISVNGAQETVAVKADFPKDEPVFMLASISGGKAKIRIAGGAFASGSPTLTLEKGKPVTLVNTADGLRYELELISVG